jgi:hypothetical protein
MWGEVRRAFVALSADDLRNIVFAHLAAYYGKNDDIARPGLDE